MTQSDGIGNALIDPAWAEREYKHRMNTAGTMQRMLRWQTRTEHNRNNHASAARYNYNQVHYGSY